MVNATDSIKCGQILILRNHKLALACDFCDRHDFYELDGFRSHIRTHFPDSEDEGHSDSDCEYVPPVVPVVRTVSLVPALQNDACGSQTLLCTELLQSTDELRPEDANGFNVVEIPDSTDSEDGDDSDRQSVYVLENIPDVTTLVPNLQTGACASQTAEAAESLLIERDWVPSNSDNDDAFIESKLRRKKCKRQFKDQKRTLPSTDVKRNDNMSEANVVYGSRSGRIYEKQRSTKQTHNIIDDVRTEVAKTSNPKSTPNETTKRRFECTFCHKVCRSNAVLLDHENTHTGQRPHKCGMCSTTFAAKSNLSNHIKVKHFSRPADPK